MSNTLHNTLIIPAYNEEHRIGPTLDAYGSYFGSRYGDACTLLVVLNGCRDNTEAMVRAAQQKYSCIEVVSIAEAVGKGGAIIAGFEQALASGADLVGYTDADGSTSPETMDRLFITLGSTPTVDCVVGSRRMPGSVVHNKSRARRLMSFVFNWTTRLYFFSLGVRDTQCGAKVVRANALPQILPNLTISNMAFDVNLLVDVRRAGGHILEMPIEWIDDHDSTITHPVKASVAMVLSLTRLRLIYSPFKFLYPALRPVSDMLHAVFLDEKYRPGK